MYDFNQLQNPKIKWTEMNFAIMHNIKFNASFANPKHNYYVSVNFQTNRN